MVLKICNETELKNMLESELKTKFKFDFIRNDHSLTIDSINIGLIINNNSLIIHLLKYDSKYDLINLNDSMEFNSFIKLLENNSIFNLWNYFKLFDLLNFYINKNKDKGLSIKKNSNYHLSIDLDKYNPYINEFKTICTFIINDKIIVKNSNKELVFKSYNNGLLTYLKDFINSL